jgi:signal transduction histidine kinase
VEQQVATRTTVDSYRTLMADADLEYIRREIPLAIEQSREGVAQIKKIVLAMKEFSHPGADEKEAVDLNRSIEATVMVARNEWKYVAEVELNLDKKLPSIEAIPSAINQTILNLVVNAAHAIEDVVKGDGSKGRITITSRRDGEFAEIAVEDTGSGIAAQNLARIFDPFFTTKKVGKGTGQGLAIVRRVVLDRHGGAIDVQSEVGKGTRFIVRLPVKAPIELEQLIA